VLVDSNVFIYALTRRSSECRFLLDRCKAGDVFGITTAEIVSEVCHRLMLIEAAETAVITRPSAADLRKRRSLVSRTRRLARAAQHVTSVVDNQQPRFPYWRRSSKW
jgi:predicted nucleic acid-binding protein